MNAADTHARSRNRWISSSAVSLALIVAAILLWRARPDESGQGGTRPPPAVVTAARAEQQTWSTQLAAIGTLEAERGVEITTAAAGIVDEIHFDSGDKVERGALIAQLDDEADRARLATLTGQERSGEATSAAGQAEGSRGKTPIQPTVRCARPGLCGYGFNSAGEFVENELLQLHLPAGVVDIDANQVSRRVVVEHDAIGYFPTFNTGPLR